MIKNYLLTAWRSINKNKSYTAINVIGLAIGITSFVLLGYYIRQDLSMDTQHAEADKIYRMLFEQKDGSQTATYALVTSDMVNGPAESIEGIESTLKIRPVGEHLYIYNDQKLKAPSLVLAEQHIFEYFNFELTEGNPKTALSEPNSIVLTKDLANKIFGKEDPVGKTLSIISGYEALLKVTGIVENNQNSHIKYQAFVSWETRNVKGDKLIDNYVWSIYAYLKTSPDNDIALLENKINQHLATTYKEWWQEGQQGVKLQALKDAYLKSGGIQFAEAFRSGNEQNIYIMGAVALFTLLIACINYININTARSSKRSLEVGIRKVLGADKKQLIGQFLGESLLIVAIATLVSALFIEVLLPYFNEFVGTHIILHWSNLFIVLISVWLIVALFSGLYPAFILSSFLPLSVIKQKNSSSGQGIWARKGLIVFQFAVSMVLIMVTLVIYQQTRYIAEKDLGFNKEQVAIIDIGTSDAIYQKVHAFQEEISQHSAVIKSSISTDILGSGYTNNSGSIMIKNQPEKNTLSTLFYVDAHFIDTYQLEVIEGANFRAGVASDSNAYIINEAMAKQLGLENPLGQLLTFDAESPGKPVIGVVKDFHFQAMHRKVQPAVFHITKNNFWNLSVRINTDQTKEALAHFESIWNKMEPNYPFEYQFVDQKFEQFYKKDRKLMESIMLFSAISIVIACLGLYGLTAFTIEQKVKEIGIRKVLGASIYNVTLLVNKPFIVLFLIAFGLAIPLAYYFMNIWLQNFAYHINIGPLPFALAGLTALFITLVTVSYQSIKAGQSNPIESLKSE